MQRWAQGEDRGGTPEPGYYEVRLVRGGPRVPARIDHSDAFGWQATIDGVSGNAAPDWVHADGVARIWHGGVRSTAESHAYLVALKSWAARHSPLHPILHPLHPIDVGILPPVLP